MSVVINGTTGITAPAFDGAVDGADLTGAVAASLLSGDVAAARITTALNASGSAPIYAARAWVNFNGTGTVAIRASGNVSSITDNGTGDYTVNFTTAMPDTDFAVIGLGSASDAQAVPSALVQTQSVAGADFVRTTSSVRFANRRTSTASSSNAGSINIAIFR